MPLASALPDLFAAVAALAGAALPLGVAAGAALALGGLGALTVATRQRRVLAAIGGALLGALAALALRGWFSAHLGLPVGFMAAVLAAVGAAGGAALPVAFPFAAAALPGALVGMQVPLAGRPAFGAAAGALVAGVVGVVLSRAVAAAFAAACGGLLVALGLLAAFGTSPLARELAERPAALLGFALILAIAGAAFQLARSPEAPADRSPGSPPSPSREAGP
jgi:hypothetical protein